MNVIKLAANKIGMDKAIAYSSAARIFQAVSGLLTAFFITLFLTGEEQGFYYTFGSLLAVQTFFELGFTGIITQYVAHEASHIQITDNNKIIGDNKYLSRLGSLLRFTVKWYTITSGAFFLALLIIGYYFFRDTPNPNNIEWLIPWIIISFATVLRMFQSPFSSILMGMNKVVEINKLMFYQQIFTPLALWICLFLRLKLYVLGISSLVTSLIWFFYIYRSKLYIILYNIFKVEILEKVSYLKEIFPYQWRIALSSLSGYFIFYFITPMIFKYQGAVISGQVGMVITIINAIQSFSMSWLNTKVPLYSRLIALNEYKNLDAIFYKTMKQMLSVCAVLMLGAYIAITFVEMAEIEIKGQLLSDRFLTGLPLVFLLIAYFTDQLSFSWATYLRCHKKEPYLFISIVTGVLCLATIYITSQYLDILCVMISYAIVKICVIPWGYYIFKYNKKKWHNE